jgi:ABC-2 type transport system permease protein
MNNPKYSQIRATLSLTLASIRSMLKTPSAIFFGIIFPLVFILIFGLLGGDGSSAEVFFVKDVDKDNPVYKVLEETDIIRKSELKTLAEAEEKLLIGQLDAILDINVEKDQFEIPKYEVVLTTSDAAPQGGALVRSVIQGIADNINLNLIKEQQKLISVEAEEVSGREYKQIDFVLPGQLGFGLLSAGIFGTAFLILDLKKTLVLKRFYSTPINKLNILIAEGISKLVFSILQAVVIIGIGHFVFGFTLINGFSTFLIMLLLSSMGLIVFLGMGLFVSSISKSTDNVAPIANLFTLPQFLLAGTFFPIDLFPDWLQIISRLLPLTYLNEAMRMVAFEGAGLVNVLPQIGALAIWAVIVYVGTSKLFKWE